MTSSHVLRSRIAYARRGLDPRVIEGYVQLWQDNEVSHELTVGLGVHPRKFVPEVQFLPQLRRIAREIAHRLRGVPKRKLLRLQPEDAVWMAGFYEAEDAAGLLFPHWHGVIALRAGEEDKLRELLVECVGEDMTPGASGLLGGSHRPVITTPKAKPTFHLRSLSSPERWIAYANKQVRYAEPTHWTINDILPPIT
jgi:hypothetical protein